MKLNFEKPNSFESEKKILVHEENIGPLKYKLEIGEKALDDWNNEVDAIYQSIQNSDFGELKELLGNDKLVERGKDILERSTFLSSEVQKHIKELLSVSLWVIDNQNHWPGNLESGFRMIKGGLQRIEKFTEEGGSSGPSCLDMSAITEALTKKRGIKGSIERLGKRGQGSRFEHRYWRSDKGFVVDTLWGIEVGGLYLSDEEYEERRRERKREKFGHVGSYNPSKIDDCIEDYKETTTFGSDQKRA